MKLKKDHDGRIRLDAERLEIDLGSPDETTRAKAVRAVCPCHSGWEPFEQNLKLVADLQKDESPAVRASAIHVFEDAAQIESEGYPTNPREATNEMLRTKRASRFPRDPDDVTPSSRHKGSKRRRTSQ